jgi:hypothetical protein
MSSCEVCVPEGFGYVYLAATLDPDQATPDASYYVSAYFLADPANPPPGAPALIVYDTLADGGVVESFVANVPTLTSTWQLVGGSHSPPPTTGTMALSVLLYAGVDAGGCLLLDDVAMFQQ